MANHKSALKRIRRNNTKKLSNKYKFKTTRNAIRNLYTIDEKKEAESSLKKVISQLDKLSKLNIIHKNKASNLKSKLTKRVATL